MVRLTLYILPHFLQVVVADGVVSSTSFEESNTGAPQ